MGSSCGACVSGRPREARHERLSVCWVRTARCADALAVCLASSWKSSPASAERGVTAAGQVVLAQRRQTVLEQHASATAAIWVPRPMSDSMGHSTRMFVLACLLRTGHGGFGSVVWLQLGPYSS